jgi:hypothetical protein
MIPPLDPDAAVRAALLSLAVLCLGLLWAVTRAMADLGAVYMAWRDAEIDNAALRQVVFDLTMERVNSADLDSDADLSVGEGR